MKFLKSLFSKLLPFLGGRAGLVAMLAEMAVPIVLSLIKKVPNRQRAELYEALADLGLEYLRDDGRTVNDILRDAAAELLRQAAKKKDEPSRVYNSAVELALVSLLDREP